MRHCDVPILLLWLQDILITKSLLMAMSYPRRFVCTFYLLCFWKFFQIITILSVGCGTYVPAAFCCTMLSRDGKDEMEREKELYNVFSENPARGLLLSSQKEKQFTKLYRVPQKACAPFEILLQSYNKSSLPVF